MSLTIIMKGPNLGQEITVQAIVVRVLEKETHRLAHALTRQTRSMPHKTFPFLWLQLFTTYLQQKKPTTLPAFLDQFKTLCSTITTVTRAIAGVIQAGKSKTFQMLTDPKTIAHILTEMGKKNLLSLSDVQLHTLIHHALAGSAPTESQAECADVLQSFLAATSGVREAAHGAAHEHQHIVLLLANLYAYVFKNVTNVEYNPNVTLQGKGEDQNAARYAVFRSLEAHMLGAMSAARVAMVDHLMSWLGNPVVARALPIEHQAKFTALKAAYAGRSIDQWPYQKRSGLTGCWDPALFAGTQIEKAGNRGGVTDLETALMQDNATGFEDDYTTGMEITFSTMTAWIQVAYDAMDAAERAYSQVDPLKSSGASDIATADAPVMSAHSFSGVDVLTGYPVNPSCRTFDVVLPSRKIFRNAGLSPVRVHTLAHARAALKSTETPIRIEADFLAADQKAVLGANPVCEPVFGELEEGGVGMPKTLRTLEDIGKTAAGYYERRLTELTKVLISFDPITKVHAFKANLSTRGLAESWRHIGILQISIGSGPPETILPLCGHWYHGKKFHDACFDGPLSLAKGTLNGVDWEWQLRPFAAIPRSATLKDMPSHMARFAHQEVEPSQSLLRWIVSTPQAIEPSTIKVSGWRIGSGRLADVVLVEVKASGTVYCFYPDKTDDRAFAVAPPNYGFMTKDAASPDPWEVEFSAEAFGTINM